jgi:hypothetical protein
VAGYEAAADAVYETLRERRFDVSRLSTRDLLRKDYKQWAMGGGGAAAAVVGVASVGMDLRSMAAKDVRMADECARWSEHCGLDLLVIMVGTLQPPAPAAPPHTHRLCELSDWLDRLGRSSVSHGEVIREHRESCVCVCVCACVGCAPAVSLCPLSALATSQKQSDLVIRRVQVHNWGNFAFEVGRAAARTVSARSIAGRRP